MSDKKSSFSVFIDFCQLITAVAALIVSGLAIWLTVTTRRDDVIYRELSIKPTLAINVSPDIGKITLKNVGLGAAIIKSVKYKSGDEENTDSIDPDPESTKALSDQIKKLQQDVIYAMVNRDFIDNQKGKNLPGLDIVGSFPAAGSVIPVNEEIVIVEIKNLKDIDASFTKANDRQSFNKWLDSIGLSYRGDFQITYCSISDKYCRSTRTRM